MNSIPRIYADFNGLQNSVKSNGYLSLYLHYWGSLKDLSRKKLTLQESMKIRVYSDSDESSDLEATGVVYFDRKCKKWFAEFSEEEIIEVPTVQEDSSMNFPCWNCEIELSNHFKQNGLQLGDECPACNVKIHKPLNPPEEN